MVELAVFALLLQAASTTKAGPDAMQAADAAFREGLSAVMAHDLRRADAAFAKVTKLAPKVAAGHSAYGAVLLQENQASNAIPQLEIAHDLDPNDASALLNLGLAYGAVASSGDSARVRTQADSSKKALEALKRWRSLTGQPLPPDAALVMTTALVKEGDIANAQAELAESLKTAPGDAGLLDAMGVLLAQQQQFSDAVPLFERAVAADATMMRAQLHLGTALMAVQRVPDAITALTRAHALAPDNIDAAYQLALALESAERPKEAIPYFEQVRTARPDDASVLINLALALVQTGKAKEAILLYKQAMVLAPKSVTLRQDLGVAYLQQSDLENAIASFRNGLALDPQNAQMLYDLGLALKLKDDLPGATEALKKAQSLDPQLSDASFTLGVLQMQQGQFDDAAESLRHAVMLRPEDGDAWAMLGSVYKQNSQSVEAAEALRKAIALAPQQPGNHINLAAVLVQLGKKDEAAAERKTAADLTRSAVNAQKAAFALDSGRLLASRGQYAEATVQYRAAVLAAPQSAEAHAALADVLMKQGKVAEAAAEQSKAAAAAKETPSH